MRLWTEGAAGGAGRAVRAVVKEQVQNIGRQVRSRGTRAVNAIRNAELEVLKGQRSGKVYRKYPYKTKYTASAPGEPPTRKSGNLWMHWSGRVKAGRTSSGGTEVIACLESQEKYAYYLENGKGMAPRPFVDRIKDKAMPGIEKIYKEPYQ